MHRLLLFALTVVLGVAAKNIVITVGGNTTQDATQVFRPPSVVALKGDVVYFNFTRGNHTVTQSTFAAPCVPAHDTNFTVNGFDSNFRNAGDGTAVTSLLVTITDPDSTIWFFDYNTCARGGVGAININGSSLETLDGFQRNAIRLNGTESSSSLSSRPISRTSTATAGTSTQTSDASRVSFNRVVILFSSIIALPVILLM